MSDPIDIDARRKTQATEDELGEVRAQKVATPLRRVPKLSPGGWCLSDREEAYRHAQTGSSLSEWMRQRLAVVKGEH